MAIELPEDISDEMWWAMCDAHLSLPVPLAEADLSKPFVYERSRGVFYVPGGYHPSAMSILLAFQHGLTCGIDVAEKLKLEFSSGTADYWLEHTPGAAFRSSVGRCVVVGSTKGLTIQERRLFGEVKCAFDN